MLKQNSNAVFFGFFLLIALIFTGCQSATDPGGGDDEDNASLVDIQLETNVFEVGQPGKPFTVVLPEGTGGTFSYQWYKNTANSNKGGTIIDGATSASFTPPTDQVGGRLLLRENIWQWTQYITNGKPCCR